MNPWTVVPLLAALAICFLEVTNRAKAIMLILLAIFVVLLHAAQIEARGDAEMVQDAREKAYNAGYCKALLTEGAPNNANYNMMSWCRVNTGSAASAPSQDK